MATDGQSIFNAELLKAGPGLSQKTTDLLFDKVFGNQEGNFSHDFATSNGSFGVVVIKSFSEWEVIVMGTDVSSNILICSGNNSDKKLFW